MQAPKIDTGAIKSLLANFIVPLAAIGVAIVLILLVIVPGIKGKPALIAELDEKVALATTLEEKYRKLNTLLDYKASVEENRILVSEVLPEESLVPQLLTQIDMIAKDAGLEVTNLSYSIGGAGVPADAESTDPRSKMISVSLGANGSYDQVLTFLANLEKAGRIVTATNLRYSVQDGTAGGPGSLALSLTLLSPYVELNTEAVTDDPITFDITDEGFGTLMDELKGYKIYRISVDEIIEIENLPETPTEPVLEGGSEATSEVFPEEPPAIAVPPL